MTEQELKEYIAKYFPRENERCEWKEFSNLKHSVSGKEMDDIISYVSAISNMNGGFLVIGVQDKTLEIRGIQDFYDYTPENLKFRILDLCTYLPEENLSVEDYTSSDTNKTVWIIQIPKHSPRKAVIAHRKAFMRRGDSLIEMTPARHETIVHEVIIGEDWTAQIVPEATMKHLDPDAVYKARAEFTKRNPKYADEIRKWDDEKFLNKVKLTVNGKITRAALILLGKDECEYLLAPGIMKIRWLLKKGGANLDYAILNIPMLLSVDAAEAKVRNLRIVDTKTQTMYPDEFMRYDSFTIREALHNCIAHQDYTMGARIEFVEFEDNRLVFRNAGSFIPRTVEDVIKSDCPESVYRNPFLAEAMRNLGLIETQGGGIRKLFKLQMRRGFALPEYSFENDYVKLVIGGSPVHKPISWEVLEKADLSDTIYELAAAYQKDLDDNNGGTTPKTGENCTVNDEKFGLNGESSVENDEKFGLNEESSVENTEQFGLNGRNSERILNLIRLNPEITAGEISMTLSITVRAVEKQIKHLREQGKIIRVGSKKSGHWQVLSDTDVVQGDE